MAYILHSPPYTVAEVTRGDPPNALLRRFPSLPHVGPSRVACASNLMSSSSGPLKQCERRGCASCASHHEPRPPSMRSSSGAVRTPGMVGIVKHGGRSTTPAANAPLRRTSTPVTPCASDKPLFHLFGSGGRHADVTTDAGLYKHAVDYTDLEEVLRCPLPPVPDCPAPCTLGKALSGRSGNCSVAAGATLSPPSSSSLPQPPLVFRCIASDPNSGVSVYSTPVEDCPMHLMRAYAVLPCSPGDVLQYMDSDIRPGWDSHIRRSTLLRELAPPEHAEVVGLQHHLSSAINTEGATVVQRSRTGLLAQSRGMPCLLEPASSRTTAATNSGYGSVAVSGPATAAASSPAAFQCRPGLRRVSIQCLETRSPVLFVHDRDFKVVVAEEVRPDGTAYMKAFSTPPSSHMPLGRHQSRYVRAVVLLSGMVARPLDAARVEEVLPPVLLRYHQAALQKRSMQVDGEKKAMPSAANIVSADAAARVASVAVPRQYCVMECVGLVHPMGWLPAVLTNIVASAQLKALCQLQLFVTQHPMPTLRPRCAVCAATGQPRQSPSPSSRRGVSHGEKSQEGGTAQRAREVAPDPSSAASQTAQCAASRASSWWLRQVHDFVAHL
ncbi:hypothetical protein GH5_04907 [Leishmania sp. Ghana 2012 LV757]|uniref:hypothetical protein n=1 Tax=Leishmania sp. Ghana 2012 LV757 TaxID=2803181 RepID=UPI001B567EC7|nr:hypothetical protein GH5_04907 [Leishmania sp. Ghana 2012 LV757]